MKKQVKNIISFLIQPIFSIIFSTTYLLKAKTLFDIVENHVKYLTFFHCSEHFFQLCYLVGIVENHVQNVVLFQSLCI